ncbi:uncharacterized protein BJ171DRAFT_615472 [Polychytrium aggregatum]|uniref:uncharacterized protein n=1 Tax=Polychytrium aggregatum TaxID=110093 RepID=UPI0022FE2873|nr:uncharacterized protein BJ171DRAFT_615472 [Polychytrium aggregatum]KAI9190710.1 hypothetical protein BJ171DRAFT_615472 [Polychytrium aggregatum]
MFRPQPGLGREKENTPAQLAKSSALLQKQAFQTPRLPYPALKALNSKFNTQQKQQLANSGLKPHKENIKLLNSVLKSSYASGLDETSKGNTGTPLRPINVNTQDYEKSEKRKAFLQSSASAKKKKAKAEPTVDPAELRAKEIAVPAENVQAESAEVLALDSDDLPEIEYQPPSASCLDVFKPEFDTIDFDDLIKAHVATIPTILNTEPLDALGSVIKFDFEPESEPLGAQAQYCDAEDSLSPLQELEPLPDDAAPLFDLAVVSAVEPQPRSKSSSARVRYTSLIPRPSRLLKKTKRMD